MKKYKVDGPVRYDLTHGRILPAPKMGSSMSLFSVEREMREQETAGVGFTLKEEWQPPNQARFTLKYSRAESDTPVVLLDETVLNLSTEQIEEVRAAMQKADKHSRPVLSYYCATDSGSGAASLVAAFEDGAWNCMTVSNISYAEIYFICLLLGRYDLTYVGRRGDPIFTWE